MTERRYTARQESFLRGFVYFGNNPSAVDCLGAIFLTLARV
jgi:hypothetical protein